MKDKRVLYVSSEVVPYLPETEISSMSFEAPKMVNDNGGQIRIFMPRYGNINERRHQLHEVIRLSGMNLVIKLNWSPDIIHVHGWLASFLPLYLRNYYGTEPLFENSKIVTSVYNQGFDNTLNDNVKEKILFDGIDEESVEELDTPNYVNLMKLAVKNSDAAIIGSDEIPQELEDYLNNLDKPVLKYHKKEEFSEAYLDFYESKVL